MSVRRVVTASLSVFILLAGARAWGQNALLVSGQSSLVVIDSDHSGEPDAMDCRISALLDNIMTGPPLTADITINTSQANMPLLRVCQLSFDAKGTKGADSSSNFAGVNIFDAHGPMGFNFPSSLPVTAELVDETVSPNINDPVRINDVSDAGEVQQSLSMPFFGALCSLGGSPVVEIRPPGSPNFLVDLPLYPNSTSPTYIKVPGPPLFLEKAAGGFDSFDAYIPLTTDGHLTFAAASARDNLLVDINVGALPVCGRIAPAFSAIGMMVAALGLLATGAWALSRRDTFARALSF